jgi:hypothetical protein
VPVVGWMPPAPTTVVVLVVALLVGVGVATSSLPVILGSGVALVALVFVLVHPQPAQLVFTASLSAGVFTVGWNALRLPGGLALADGFLIVAALAAVVAWLVERRPVRWTANLRRLAGFGVLVFAGGIVGGTVAGGGDAGLPEAFGFASSLATSLVVAAAVIDDDRLILRLARWWALGAAASVAFELLGSTPGVRAVGLTNHPNHFGMSMLIAAFLAIAWFRSAQGWTRIAALAAAGSIVWGLVESGSRGALLGLVIGFVALTLLSGARSVPLVVASLTVAVVTLAVVPIPTGSAAGDSAVGRLLSSDAPGVDVANRERLSHLDEALHVVRVHPLTGVGFSNARAAHSLPLQVLVTAGALGLAGLVLVATFIGSAVAASWRSRWVKWRVAVTAGLIGLVAALFVSNSMWDRYVLLYLALVGATTAGTTRVRSARAGRDASAPSDAPQVAAP